MKIADFVNFKIANEALKQIKGGVMEIVCSVNVGFPDGTGFVNIGACSGSNTSACQSTYGANLCSQYTQMGASSCDVTCTANAS